MGIPKVKSATSLRNELYETLKEVSEGEPQLITHKQGDPVLLLSKFDFDKIMEEKEALRKMAVGLSEIESGKGIPHKEALSKIRLFQKRWK